MEEDKYKDIVSRLQALERHIVNLIIPLQGLDKFVSDSKFRDEMLRVLQYLSGNKLQVNEAPFNRMRADLERLSDKMDKIGSMELGQTFAEIKYIGNRLNEIEKVLKRVDQEGIKQKVSLDFSVNGYEMVKRPKDYDEEDVEDSKDDKVNDVLNELEPIGKKIVALRLGLLGNEPRTFKKISDETGICYGTTREIYKRNIRRLRHPIRQGLVKRCDNDALKREVLGSLQ